MTINKNDAIEPKDFNRATEEYNNHITKARLIMSEIGDRMYSIVSDYEKIMDRYPDDFEDRTEIGDYFYRYNIDNKNQKLIIETQTEFRNETSYYYSEFPLEWLFMSRKERIAEMEKYVISEIEKQKEKKISKIETPEAELARLEQRIAELKSSI